MREMYRVRDLASVDAIAVRAGPRVVVIVSSVVSILVRQQIADQLAAMLAAQPAGCDVAVTLARGAAATLLPRTQGPIESRWPRTTGFLSVATGSLIEIANVFVEVH